MKKAINIEIGNRIRSARNRVGMTRENLAEKTNVTSRFIADVERGNVGVSVSTLKKICEVLNISSDSLLWDKTTRTSIDDKLKFIDEEQVYFIDKMVQTQLDLISYMENNKNNDEYK